MRKSRVVMLPCAAASVPEARRRITADLAAAGVFDGAVRDAALVVSELLSNAVRHARPLPGARLRLTWIVAGGAVEVAVSDGGGTTCPRAGQPSAWSLGGRGLGIVEHLCRDWGVRNGTAGSTVWAVLAAPSRHPNGTTQAAH